MTEEVHHQDSLSRLAAMMCAAVGVDPQDRMRRPEIGQCRERPVPQPNSMDRNRETGQAAVQSTDNQKSSGADMSSYWRSGVVERIHHNGYAFINCRTLSQSVFLPPPLLLQVKDLITLGDKVQLRCFKEKRSYVVSCLNIDGRRFELGK